MQDDVEIAVDVKVGKLQGTRKGELEVYIVWGRQGGGRWSRWESAGERGVIMDVKFEKVEEGVWEGGDGAVYIWKAVSERPLGDG